LTLLETVATAGVYLLDLIAELEGKLRVELTKLMDLQESLDVTQLLVADSERLVKRYKKALDVLQGTESETESYETQVRPAVGRVEEAPREVPTPDVSPRRQVVPVDTRPLCNACGGRMEPGSRTLQSGKTVTYLVCTDSGCNNEQF
jgi:hypothetical protein